MNHLPGHGQPVLYLDFDGVLHPEDVWRHPRRGTHVRSPAGHSLFEHNLLLESLLSHAPDVQIVLSTSWVRVFSFSRAVRQLAVEVQARVIGATFHSEMHMDAFAARPRWEQILLDVRRRQPCDWIAVDDDTEGWPDEHRQRLVASDPVRGIGHPDVRAQLQYELSRLGGSAQ